MHIQNTNNQFRKEHHVKIYNLDLYTHMNSHMYINKQYQWKNVKHQKINELTDTILI